MFEQVCKEVAPCLTVVGYAPQPGIFSALGRGCLLSESIAITAAHVTTEITSNHGAILVSCKTGLWQCDVLWESQSADIAVVMLVQNLKAGETSPATYPQLATELPALGMAVGYMARHDTIDGNSGQKHKAPSFFGGWICRREPDFDSYPRFRMTPTYAINGFSGAPVITPAGQLIAIHVGCGDMWMEFEADKKIGVVMPEMSPVFPSLADIQLTLRKALGLEK